MINWTTIILALVAQLPALIVAMTAHKRIAVETTARINGQNKG